MTVSAAPPIAQHNATRRRGLMAVAPSPRMGGCVVMASSALAGANCGRAATHVLPAMGAALRAAMSAVLEVRRWRVPPGTSVLSPH
jgi:hypothetical protein